jgi:hypothetical protein
MRSAVYPACAALATGDDRIEDRMMPRLMTQPRKTLLCLSAGLLLALAAASALAADVTGTWTADAVGPDGSSYPLTFTFKQDGAKLTGTVQGPQGDAIDISNGKVDGNNISFEVSFNGMTITHSGTVNDAGDEIKLSTKSDQPDFPAHDLTLKKAKPQAQPAQ